MSIFKAIIDSVYAAPAAAETRLAYDDHLRLLVALSVVGLLLLSFALVQRLARWFEKRLSGRIRRALGEPAGTSKPAQK